MRSTLRHFAAASAFAGLAAFTGCQDATTYESQKPVINDPAVEDEVELEERQDYDADNDTLGESMEEAGEDISDAVTPDRTISDVDTPIGDVEVTEDPATGRKRVDVDTPRADVDVDADNQ
ncbi:hypothetical protein [Botrimarina mediterranea]|uniref:Secreted protein n=1 Tax=Botrimarina mediterranea TaxID=2528022 RepID=A0A518KCU8_9BACT|nr:hypothetical protein [Botrimarina mediterranea]QDV75620.1 hypothetical protein Spa11_38400 [Botrimarina mediterranea]QDV80255.1 hypothetical protein K2D_38810 [Planctomycetes bacterium K2D]